MAGGRGLTWGVVVAAGGLVPDPLAGALGTPRKALARFGDRTSLARTLDAVAEAGFERCAVVGGEDAAPEVHHGQLVPEAGGAVANARVGVDALGDGIEGVLFLPADAPLMRGPMLRAFTCFVEMRLDGLSAAGAPPEAGRWYAFGLCRLNDYVAAYPEVHKEAIHLRGGSMVSGALYAASPAGFRHAFDLIDVLQRSRKSQLRMAMRLGVGNMIRFFLRRLDLRDGERILGRAMQGSAFIAADCHPATCLDFDDVRDVEAIRKVLARGGG
jgi:hypothetical protein